MLKKNMTIAVILLLVFSLSACGTKENTKSQEDTQKEETEKEPAQNKEEEELGEGEEDIQEEPVVEDPISEKVSIQVFSSDENATQFVSQEVEIASLSQAEVLNALIAKGVLTSDVQMLGFKTVDVDGKKAIEADFNQSFADYVRSMGTAGEYYIIGGVCNTFLDAFGCEQIKITVEGKTLETGHADYPGYMTTFP